MGLVLWNHALLYIAKLAPSDKVQKSGNVFQANEEAEEELKKNSVGLICLHYLSFLIL